METKMEDLDMLDIIIGLIMVFIGAYLTKDAPPFFGKKD